MNNYLLELAIIHSALVLGYWIFLREEQQYQKMRFYLIGTTLLALTIPLLKLPKLFLGQQDQIITQVITMGTATLAPTPAADHWYRDVVIWSYFAISGYFIIKLISGLVLMFKLKHRSHYQTFRNLGIHKVGNISGSFTFFHWIFLSDTIEEDHQEYEAILKHEQAHAVAGHTYDLLFLELFKACFWWLPSAWYVNKEIRKIHEYQADNYALKWCQLDQYSSILISSTLKSNGLSLASSFHDGLIVKRLNAMKKRAKKVSPWKLGILSVLCTLLVVVFACTEQLEPEYEMSSGPGEPINFNQLPSKMQESLREVKDDYFYFRLKNDDEFGRNFQKLGELNPTHGATHTTIEEDFIYLAWTARNSSQIDNNAGKEEVLSVVEQQPHPIDGMDAFYQYIAQNMKYPLQARRMGIEGKVFVQFVVEKDGSISQVQAVKGIGAGCDEEAVRVLQSAPAFKPGFQRGKPVRVRMEMPVIFKLDHGKTNPDNSTQGVIIIDEMETNNPGELTVEASYDNGMWSGKVLAEGEGLPGANVLVEGTNNGAATDLSGYFEVKANPSDNLMVSFVGYQTVIVSGNN